MLNSPPNLSKIASRIVIQTILSATIDAAGTAQESVRSLCASCTFFVLISIDFKGFVNVESGFISALIKIFWPLVIPPSIPPELLFVLIYFWFLNSISSCNWLPKEWLVLSLPNDTLLMALIDDIDSDSLAFIFLSHEV